MTSTCHAINLDVYKIMKKQISITIDEDTYFSLKRLSDKHDRTISNLVLRIVKKHLLDNSKTPPHTPPVEKSEVKEKNESNLENSNSRFTSLSINPLAEREDISAPSESTGAVREWRLEQLEPWARWWRKVGLKIGPATFENAKRLYDKYGEASILAVRDSIQASDRWPDQIETAIQEYDKPKSSKNDAILDMMFAGPEPANLKEALKYQDAYNLYRDGMELTQEQAQDLWLYSPEFKPKIIGQTSQTAVSKE